MKVALMKLKSQYLSLWSRYYSKKYQKYLAKSRILTIIAFPNWYVTFEKARRREEYSLFVQRKKSYYQEKLRNCNEKLAYLNRELFLIS